MDFDEAGNDAYSTDTSRGGGGNDLQESMERLGVAFEEAPVGMAIKDAEGRPWQSNPALQKMLGYTAEELRNMSRSEFTHPGDAARDVELYAELLREERNSYRLEKRYLRKDGSVVWGRLSVSRVPGGEGHAPFVLGVVEDIDERRKAEEALRVSEERFRTVIEQSPLSIHVFTPEGTSLAANSSWNKLWALREGEEPEGHDVYEDQQLKATGLLRYIEESVEKGAAVSTPPLLHDPARTGREGPKRWLEASVYPVKDEAGSIREMALVIEDVTERKRLEEKLAHQAFHDSLTGLPNRLLFLDRLGQALARAGRRSERDTEHDRGREGDATVAVLFVDLDNFKYVNDSLGHEAGDRLLCEVAGRIEGRLRPADTVARLGGDEFVVLLEDLKGSEEALRAAQRIAEVLASPFTIRDQEIFAPASTGVVLGGADKNGVTSTVQAEDLLRKADLAMYEAKKQGGARHVFFEEAMGARVGARLKLESDLRQAVGTLSGSSGSGVRAGEQEEEFTLYYQPKVSLANGRTVGMEALLRWAHPERGLVSPAEFIGLAEDTGLIVPIGWWVLRRACDQAHKWGMQWGSEPREGESAPTAPPTVWVNLSARQLHEPDLSGRISEILQQVGLQPEALGLEITESVLLGDGSASVSMLEDLKALGVKLAVDDFGTGYSSLAYLKRLPVDYLKIDRSFISGLGTGAKASDDETIVSAVMGLARAMKLGVVAEGVETEEQARCLREMGCEIVQGYYFARPLPTGEASSYLATA